MSGFVANDGAALPVELRRCDICGGPYFAGAPGSAPVRQAEAGISITIDPGSPERAWCIDHWPWRNSRGPWQPELFGSHEIGRRKR